MCVVQCSRQCFTIGQLKINVMDVWEMPGQKGIRSCFWDREETLEVNYREQREMNVHVCVAKGIWIAIMLTFTQ